MNPSFGNVLSIFVLTTGFSIRGFSSDVKSSDSIVPHFSAGEYVLVEGDESSCRDGNFYVSDDRKYIWLGPLYSFTVKSGVRSTKPATINDRKNCVFTITTQVQSDEQKTTFKSVDILKCGNKKHQEITDVARIYDDKITFEQELSIEPDDPNVNGGKPANCLWKRKKAK